ncbi:hypothetical protein NW915_17500, partial [Enterobacter hormaechei subsp. hoffmannii]
TWIAPAYHNYPLSENIAVRNIHGDAAPGLKSLLCESVAHEGASWACVYVRQRFWFTVGIGNADKVDLKKQDTLSKFFLFNLLFRK